MYLILLGAPGAGKGTQAQLLTQKLGLAHLASGDLFREAMAQGTELGLKARAYVEKGLLVPDAITIRLILEKLDGLGAGPGVLLDGFPRTLEQARALEAGLQARGRQVDRVVLLEVATEELVRRLSGRWLCRLCQTLYHQQSAPPRVAGRCDRCGGELYQRPDDTEDTVRKRLEVYQAQTTPLIDFYRRAGKLMEVKGEGSPEAVGRTIAAALARVGVSPGHGNNS